MSSINQSRRTQLGQASVEYLVVTAFTAVVLLSTSGGQSALSELLAGIKKYYAAYSYTISVTPQKL